MIWKHTQLIIIGVLFGVIIICASLFQISKSRSFQVYGGLTQRVETAEKVVALTFDDAPLSREHTDQVLKVLGEKGVKATFYAIGNSLEQYPESGRDIAMAGHEIGNHSYSHTRMVLKTSSFIKDEVKKTDELIREAGYTGEITFRPPYGKKLVGLPRYLNERGQKTIMWDVEPDTDPEVAADAMKIADYTIQNTKPGSIILMHPFCPSCGNDREALSKVIDELQIKGYRFVTVSELLSYHK